MKIRPIFAWYDLWIGVFIDMSKKRVYVFPIPCFGLVIDYSKPIKHLCSICNKKEYNVVISISERIPVKRHNFFSCIDCHNYDFDLKRDRDYAIHHQPGNISCHDLGPSK